jgi:alpha-N-acetylglucosamine transferase
MNQELIKEINRLNDAIEKIYTDDFIKELIHSPVKPEPKLFYFFKFRVFPF